jgi:hypothetical protein
LVVDLQNSKNNAKIGELKLCVEIVEMDNPSYRQIEEIFLNQVKNNGVNESKTK